MNIDRAIELMKVERECVTRNDGTNCDRDCANCDLCDSFENSSEIIEAYDTIISKMENWRKGRSSISWMLIFTAYIPTAIFTAAACHFIDCGNWVSAVIFLFLLILTLPRYGVK